MSEPMLEFVRGHRVNGHVYEFPHRCPGIDCAVAAWLMRKDERIVFEGLKQAAALAERRRDAEQRAAS